MSKISIIIIILIFVSVKIIRLGEQLIIKPFFHNFFNDKEISSFVERLSYYLRFPRDFKINTALKGKGNHNNLSTPNSAGFKIFKI